VNFKRPFQLTSSIGDVWAFVAVSARSMHSLKNGNFHVTTKPASRLRALQNLLADKKMSGRKPLTGSDQMLSI